MPALEQTVIDDVAMRLRSYLGKVGGYGEPVFLDAGGSSAVFRVDSSAGARAFKAFNPEFLNGPAGAAERRRLDVQRSLIGHSCESLIQTFKVEEAEGTAFMEMEFVPWPQLTKELANVPDDAVVHLITQLVDAVKFLESQDIVHRDIKPENIHVSADFSRLKLLDLGVAREFDFSGAGDAAVTDQGNLRPFLATAQYSSPEYLFRLDEPTSRLWRGLNFYQIGAVLHDLIMKRPLFQHEMELGNRWLLTRAILTKAPSFADSVPNRLSQLKALAARCLVKDIDTRLQLVGWEDFILEGANDPLKALKGRLAKGRPSTGEKAGNLSTGRLEFDRTEFVNRFTDRVRTELIATCGPQLPITTKTSAPDEPPTILFRFALSKQTKIECQVGIEWSKELYERSANITLCAQLSCSDEIQSKEVSKKVVCVATILEAESETALSISTAIAKVVGFALDLTEGTENLLQLHGWDLQTENEPEKAVA